MAQWIFILSKIYVTSGYQEWTLVVIQKIMNNFTINWPFKIQSKAEFCFPGTY